jgi:DNA-binding response OmpR family regulator
MRFDAGLEERMATMLVVEDDANLARLLARELEAVGYQVRLALDGETALRLFDEVRPDLVILDWMLPGMDGIDVLRRLRLTTAVPVLMLTARAEEVDRVIGLELGADDYLTKPFGKRELVARTRALLRRGALLREQIEADYTRGSATQRYGALELDPVAHDVRLGGEPIDLSPTEFDLLSLLLRNPGRAFGRTYLHDAVWKESYVDGDRSVDNAVLRLRKKLGELGDRVETVWGVGYRLRSEA